MERTRVEHICIATTQVQSNSSSLNKHWDMSYICTSESLPPVFCKVACTELQSGPEGQMYFGLLAFSTARRARASAKHRNLQLQRPLSSATLLWAIRCLLRRRSKCWRRLRQLCHFSKHRRKKGSKARFRPSRGSKMWICVRVRSTILRLGRFSWKSWSLITKGFEIMNLKKLVP